MPIAAGRYAPGGFSLALARARRLLAGGCAAIGLLGVQRFDPRTRDLFRRGIDPIEGVDPRDVDDKCCKASFIVVPCGVIPDLVAHRVWTIAQACRSFGERERGALGIGEIRRFTPCADCENASIRLTHILQGVGMHLDADAAAVDLARAQVYKFESPRRDAALRCRGAKSDERFQSVWEYVQRIVDSRFDLRLGFHLPLLLNTRALPGALMR